MPAGARWPHTGPGPGAQADRGLHVLSLGRLQACLGPGSQQPTAVGALQAPGFWASVGPRLWGLRPRSPPWPVPPRPVPLHLHSASGVCVVGEESPAEAFSEPGKF